MESIIYLAASGGTISDGGITPMIPARLDYRVSAELRLLRSEGSGGSRGGAMVLGDTRCAARTAPPAALCHQVVGECRQRAYTAVAADFSSPAQAPLFQLLQQLAPLLAREGISLLVSPAYADAAPDARVLLPCVFHSGTLRGHLEQYRRQWGHRAALDLSRMCHLVPPGGSPQPLAREELRRLRIRLRPMSFYSRELFTNYFTYRSGTGRSLVLFDEENTLRQKLLLADGLGFSPVFLLHQEVEDLLPRLLRDLREHGTIRA